MTNGGNGSKCVFSIDVEDWFHVLDVNGAPDLAMWDALPSVVEPTFLRMLDTLDEHRVRATCFFLGWIACKYPALVREASRRGHEIASHGYGHGLAYNMTAEEFFEDALRARLELEDLTGRPVSGYRCPGFSVTERVPWYFEQVRAAGYRYDSSVFPAPRGHGGMTDGRRDPHLVRTAHGTLAEFPITVANDLARPVCFFGGGYLRAFPLALIDRMTRKVLGEGRPVIFYIHPREIDPDHPRISMGMARRFKSYVNLHTTEGKIAAILKRFRFTTINDLFVQMWPGVVGNGARKPVTSQTRPAASHVY